MLPPEAFKSQQQFNQFDEFYDDYYGGEAPSGTNYEVTKVGNYLAAWLERRTCNVVVPLALFL